MNRMSKIGSGLFGLVTSLLVMVSFQNCGKITLSDAVNSNGSAKLAADGAAPTPDSMIIDIKAPSSPLMPSEAGPMVNNPAPKSNLNPAPALTAGEAQTTVKNSNPANITTTNPGQTVTVTGGKKHCNVDLDDEDDDNDTDSNHHGKKHMSKHSEKKHHKDHEKIQDGSEKNEAAENCDVEISEKKVTHCGDFEIQDILLSINSAGSEDLDDDKATSHFEITDKDKTISLNKTNLKLKARHDGKLKELFLGLNSEGNKVLSGNLQVINMKTAVSKGAGLKVKLDREIEIKEGHEYSLRLTIDQDDQVVENPARCLFKPVIKLAVLSED